ncbi:MAG TPA: cysteine desulfurase [Chloroflexia bacterium]|nr:cysteine desulfurase [Chloroflexia bacterium]
MANATLAADAASTSRPAPDWAAVRADFPILRQEVHGYPLCFLDNTATAQKPEPVLAAMDAYYRTTNANIHRGVYQMSEQATALYEDARARIAAFINARSSREIIYTRNTTEAINLVAATWGRANIGPGDAILYTAMEHHSNIVPWQLLAQDRGATVRYIPIDDDGRLVLDDLDALLDGVKIVAVTYASNVLGTINPVAEITEAAHRHGAVILIDGAQAVPHMPVDVQALACDFLAFSSHKMLGPTGIGCLYGRRSLLEAMPPYQGGGDMIRRVTLERSTWNDLPWKFEAGTPAIAEAIGLGAAVDYLSALGMDNVRAHEQQLVAYALDRLATVPGLRVLGPPAAERGGVAAFSLGEIHPHDIASLLDQRGIAIRAGHHCCQPIMDYYDVPALARASFYIYNTEADVDRLVEGLHFVREVFGSE